mgnify:CR=1 FL=1
MSPWIRKSAFMNDRGPLIENFLADENKRIFIAYSEPAQSPNDEKPMIDEEVEPGIKNARRSISKLLLRSIARVSF